MPSLSSIKDFVKKNSIGVAAASATVILLGALAFRHSNIASLETALADESAVAKKQGANISNGIQLEEQLASLREINGDITSRLLNPDDLAINLQYFYKLEAETGIKLSDIRQGGTSSRQTSGPSFRAIQYSVSIQGTFSQVLSFVRHLEQGNVFCRIVTADCNGGNNSDSQEKKESPTVYLSLNIEILGKV